jgi:hypothetical protein
MKSSAFRATTQPDEIVRQITETVENGNPGS